MRKLLPAVLAVLILLMLIPLTGPWKWRTHGGVYGTRGVAKVVYDRIAEDPGIPGYIVENLRWETIRSGAVAPDKWRMAPYYVDEKHLMTYVENQGGEWLLEAESLRDVWATQDVSDNLSYYLGIAAHYWADLTQYTHHDNARSYYEDLYGGEIGYQIWDSYHDHIEWQAEHHRPKDPALIIQDGGAYADLSSFLSDAREQMYTFIDRTMPPNNQMGGWLGDWIESRKCEASDYSVYANGNADNVHYGSKELVDMATELVYSGWVYALDVEGSVTADRITWSQWWSREHREPGVSYIGF
jgi:hypothetical protein